MVKSAKLVHLSPSIIDLGSEVFPGSSLFGKANCPLKFLVHVADDGGGEFASLDFLRPFHLTDEVIGDDLLVESLFKTLCNQIGGFLPANVLQHHDTAEQERTGVHFVEVGVLGRSAVCGLE